MHARRSMVHEGKTTTTPTVCMSAPAPFGSDECDLTERDAEAQVLKQHLLTARGLYESLVASGERWVKPVHYEDQFEFQWREQDVRIDGHAHRMDPYFRKMLDVLLSDSVMAYLNTLDRSLCSVRGLEPSQMGAWVSNEMDGVRRSTWFHLSKLLLQPTTSKDHVIEMIKKLRDENVPSHVAAVKQRLRQQINGVRALLLLASTSEEDLEEILQNTDHDMATLVACPPKELVVSMAARKFDLSELTSVYSNSNGLVQGSSSILPPSVGVRADVVSRWLERNKEAVSECCVACLSVMRRQVNMNTHEFSHFSWSGVQLSPEGRANEPILPTQKAELWVGPSHLFLPETSTTRLLVHTGELTHMNVRCVRFFEVLIQQTHMNLLPANTWRANAMLPVVSRAVSETARTWSLHVLRHDLDREDVVLKRQRATPSPNPVQGVVVAPTVATVASASSCAENVLRGPVVAQAVAEKPASCVHPKLLRDHAILNSLCMCLNDALQTHGNIRVSPTDIVASIRSRAPALASSSDASLRQAVAHVCQKIIDRAHEKMRTDSTEQLHVAYSNERDRKADGKVGGVIASKEGGTYLQRFALTTVHAMAFNSPKFLEKWMPSRSAQARAASVARGLGVKCGSKRPKEPKAAPSEGSEENGP